MCRKAFLTASVAALITCSLNVSAAEYKIDKAGQHAFIQFRIQHLGYSWLYGAFRDFDGHFTFDEANPADDNVSVTINTNSLDTHHNERDQHLRSADFLNTSEYPQATFVSTAVSKQGENYKIIGNLTLNGVTKPVTLDARLMGEGKDPWGGYRAGFEASGEIALKTFNIKKDLGPAAQTAELIISVEGIRQ